MSFTVKTLETPSTDHIHTLKGVLYIPDGEIKGIFHVVHGMCEYIGRYEPMFSFFAENGYLCCGYDNLGHGETARNEEELGFIAHKDGWKHLVNDVKAFEDAVVKLYPDKPVFLMGHSMGSFIVRLAAEKGDLPAQKLIACGTAGPNPISGAGLLLTKLIRLLRGEKHRSALINAVAFGSYNKRFEGDTPFEWLTKDETVIAQYMENAASGYIFTVSGMHDLIELIRVSNRGAWFSSLPKDLPVLLIAGEDDPVGDYGKGVKTVYRKLSAAGQKEVTLKLYENCRHEIHNDTCRDEMFADILAFLEK